MFEIVMYGIHECFEQCNKVEGMMVRAERTVNNKRMGHFPHPSCYACPTTHKACLKQHVVFPKSLKGMWRQKPHVACYSNGKQANKRSKSV